MFVSPVGPNPQENQPLVSKGHKPSFLGRAWKAIKDAFSALISLLFFRTNAASIRESSLELSSKQAVPVKGEDSATDLFKEVVVEGESNKSSTPKVMLLSKDPLAMMGDIGNAAVDRVEESQDPNEDLTQDVVQTAINLMKEKPDAPDAYDYLTQALVYEYNSIMEFASVVNGKGVEPTLESIREKMTEWGFELTTNAQAVLEELNQKPPKVFEQYFQSTRLLDEQFHDLQPFASRFEKLSPDAHAFIQGTLSVLEQKKSELDAQMCQQVQSTLKPNPAIPGVGNCLFESVNHQLSLLGEKAQGQAHVRKLAVDYMRKHRDDFRDGIIDYMKGNRDKFESIIIDKMRDSEIDKLFTDYLSKRKMNVPQWKDHLEKTLKGPLSVSDYYFDCLENYGGGNRLSDVNMDLYFKYMETTTLWGGSNEIIALSETLQRPIIVFTQQDLSSWRVDMMIGTKYNAKPMKIYYNGIDHYQDLIDK